MSFTSPSLLARILIVLVLIGTACSSEPTAEEKAAARAALLGDGAQGRRSDQASDPDDEPPVADDSIPAGQPSADDAGRGAIDPEQLDQALASVPDDGLRVELAAALGLVITAQAVCNDLGAWTTAVDAASAATTTAASSTSALAGDWVGSPQAETMSAAFRQALVLQLGCESGAGSGDVDAALAAAGRAAAANDELHLALTALNPSTGSEFWYHADQVGHTIEIDRLVREEGPLEILVIGPSTAKRGFDPGVMTAELGRSTMNAAVAGLFPAAMSDWTTDAVRLSSDPDTVIIGVSTFQDFLECTDDRRNKMADASALQTRAFASLDILASVEPAHRLVGGSAATYRSAVLDEYDPAPGSRGQMESPDVPNPESVAYYTNLYTPRMAQAEYCEQNALAVRQVVTDLVEQGHEVLVVSLPLSPAMAALHPEGRQAHDRPLDAYREVTDAAGAGWLDLTDLLDEQEFLDLTHATSGGRAKITAATIEALR